MRQRSTETEAAGRMQDRKGIKQGMQMNMKKTGNGTEKEESEQRDE